jgi:hypothetical protein
MHKSWLIPTLASLFLLAVIAVARAVHFAFFYRVFAQESACADFPPGSTVLALGFEYLGEANGSLAPGEANAALARQLALCADRFAQVVTQKAISDALQQAGLLENGLLLGRVPIRQMHPHQAGASVRTLQALESALRGLDPLPETVVLLAHDKQIERSFWDLRSLYTGTILLWKINAIPYARPGWAAPLRWALRELYLARPADFLQRWQKAHS